MLTFSAKLQSVMSSQSHLAVTPTDSPVQSHLERENESVAAMQVAWFTEPTTDPQTALAALDSHLSHLSFDDRLDLLEEAMRAEYPVIDIPPTHYLTDGVYVREVCIPAGTLLISRVHTAEHVCVVSSGVVLVIHEHGISLVAAPFTFVSPPGSRRVGLAYEDTVWTTIHKNADNETDIDAIEHTLYVDRPRLDTPTIDTDHSSSQLPSSGDVE